MNDIIAFDFPEARHSDIYCWLEQLNIGFHPVAQGQFDWTPPTGAKLLVTAQGYSATHANIILEAKKSGIKTLLLADGILEFRNTYRNPHNTPGSLFMPLVADKIACISWAQAARIESWGNPGRCEVVGLPMMDRVKRTPPPRTPASRPFRLLIATAQTPWFDDKQREIVLKSLADLRDTVRQAGDMEIWWRLAPQAAGTLGVTNHIPRFQDMKMDACIDQVDAVISTPSTLLLYPMLQGKPAVALDYTRSPAYMQTAWTITAAEQIIPTLHEIRNPPGDKMWFQRQTLEDNLACAGSATERLGHLMARMLETNDTSHRLLPPIIMCSIPQTAPELASFFKAQEYENRTESLHQILSCKSKSELEKQLLENSVLRNHISDLLTGKDWLEQQYKNWMSEAEKFSGMLVAKENHIEELINGKSWLEEQYNNWKTQAASLAALLKEKELRVAELETAKQQLEQQCAALAAQVSRLTEEPGQAPDGYEIKPLVSIVTPFFNTGSIFHETAESVFKQTLQDWEWLIVNDGSTNPEALAILEDYRQKDKRITIIDHPVNKGLSATRNTGAKSASAQFIMFLDSDDLLEPTCIEKLFWKLETHPELAFVDSYCTGFGAQQYLWEKGFVNGAAFLEENFATSNSMVRRNVLLEVGGFDESRRSGLEDWDFWLKCADCGHWGSTIKEPLTYYRRRDNHGEQWYDLNKKGIHDFKTAISKKYPRLTTASFPNPWHKWHMPFQPVSLEIPKCRTASNTRKPAILFILPHLAMGGADKWNLDLIDELVNKHGWHATIATTNSEYNPWFSYFHSITKDIHILSRFLTLPDYLRYLLHLINTRSPDIVCLSNSRMGYSLLPVLHAYFPKIPFVDYVHMEEEHWRSGGYAMDSIRISSILAATGVSSNYLKNWMVTRGGSESKIHRIYTNIDTKKWLPHTGDRTPLLNKWNIQGENPIILYACRLASQKQPEVFSKTVEQFLRAGNKATFIIAGDGPLSSIIANLQSANPKYVKWLGAVSLEVIKELMAISDIFFLPSKMEGIALSFYEAMAMGVVPVGADVSGQRELVTEDCGVLIKQSTDEAGKYAQILAQLLSNPEVLSKMKAACRARVIEHFELKQMTISMLGLFDQALRDLKENPLPKLPSRMIQTYASEIIEQIRLENLADGLWAERGDPNFNKRFRNSSISPRLSPMKRSILRFIIKHF